MILYEDKQLGYSYSKAKHNICQIKLSQTLRVRAHSTLVSIRVGCIWYLRDTTASRVRVIESTHWYAIKRYTPSTQANTKLGLFSVAVKEVRNDAGPRRPLHPPPPVPIR